MKQSPVYHIVADIITSNNIIHADPPILWGAAPLVADLLLKEVPTTVAYVAPHCLLVTSAASAYVFLRPASIAGPASWEP